MKTKEELIASACKTMAPNLFADDLTEAHRAASPILIEVARKQVADIATEVIDAVFPEVEKLIRERDHYKACTGNKIGFTYEPTGERVNLYTDNHRSFKIIADHPEILKSVTESMGGPSYESFPESKPKVNVKDFINATE